MKFTTEEIITDISRRREQYYNPASSNNKPLAVLNPVSSINTICNNIEYNNKASNLADRSARDLLASLETSSPVGESRAEGLVGQEEEVSVIPTSGIVNPAKIWGIEAQQGIEPAGRKHSHPIFAFTIQFNGQIDSRRAKLVTLYTYDRYWDYKPTTEAEQGILDIVKEKIETAKKENRTSNVICGRFRPRNCKSESINDLVAYAELRNGVYQVHMLNLVGEEQITLTFNEPVTEAQQKYYIAQARYGQSIDLGRRKSVSIFDVETEVGGRQ